MQIQRDGRVNEQFGSELERLMKQKGLVQEAKKKEEEKPITEKQLDDEGEHKNDKGKNKEQISEIMEPQLKKERAKETEEKPTTEKQLEESRKEAASPNTDKTGLTEKRLDEASKAPYPHRNPEAHERTGEKRPINALPEELGDMSDEAKLKRYEKAAKKEPKTKEAFNLHKQQAEKFANYLKYRADGKYNLRLAHVKKLDEEMSGILAKAEAEKRPLTADEQTKIAAMKKEKVNTLKLGN